MADLYTLFYGRKKTAMRPIMTDSLHKVKNYMKAREKNVPGFHEIRPAEKGAVTWKQKTCTIGGNRASSVIRINRRGQNQVNGWISKDGFQPHT